MASIQKRTSPVKFAHLAEKSGKGSISNLSTKVSAAGVPTCGCLAKNLGFTIDCTATADIEAKYDALVANCLTDCSSASCAENFAFIEAHHDFCLHDQVPKEVEVGFHDLEEVCAKQCDIGRLKDPDHSVCPDMTCPDEAGVVQVVNDLFALGCKDTCTNDNACGENFRKLRLIHDVCPALDDKAFEWAGIFPISGTSTTWLMQKVDGSYADPAMKVVFIPVAANEVTAAKLEELENVGSNLLSPVTGTCDVVNSGATITPVADGSCFDLTVDASSDDSTFIINTDGIVGLAVYAQHVPLEFERDLHYLYDTALAVGADTNAARDTAGANVEPSFWEGPWGWEWVGVFPISGDSTTWLMQKVDGAYADPSMKLVLLPTTTADLYKTMQDSMTSVFSDMLTGDGCTAVAEGGSITPVAGGSCFELTNDDSKTDSTFVIDTSAADLTGLVVFAQHVPTEFERDLHYLYDTAKAVGADTNDARDTAGANVEPVAQEGGGGGHSHGHRRLSKMQRRLLDVDAALHDFEDPCDAVGCYIEPEGCSDTVDLTSRSDLQVRAAKKCHQSWFIEGEGGREVGRSVSILGSQPSRSFF